jgi:hypothetical protein
MSDGGSYLNSRQRNFTGSESTGSGAIVYHVNDGLKIMPLAEAQRNSMKATVCLLAAVPHTFTGDPHYPEGYVSRIDLFFEQRKAILDKKFPDANERAEAQNEHDTAHEKWRSIRPQPVP